MKYKIVDSKPVARFWYKGTHTHPVRRTVLIIEQTEDWIRGYELREGKTVRRVNKAPVKTFRKSRIAKGASLRQENPIRKLYPDRSTLVRKPLLDIVEVGP
jgi:hypothetical protein